MIRIVFKNLDESEIAKEAVLDRLQATIERFPELEHHQLSFTISMDNSQFKPGPDLFKVKLIIKGTKYGGVILEKSSRSLYTALADLYDHMLERLNRYGDRQRVRDRNTARKITKEKKIIQKAEPFEENNY